MTIAVIPDPAAEEAGMPRAPRRATALPGRPAAAAELPRTPTERRLWRRYQMELRGISIADVARWANVDRALVSRVFGEEKRSARVERAAFELVRERRREDPKVAPLPGNFFDRPRSRARSKPP